MQQLPLTYKPQSATNQIKVLRHGFQLGLSWALLLSADVPMPSRSDVYAEKHFQNVAKECPKISWPKDKETRALQYNNATLLRCSSVNMYTLCDCSMDICAAWKKVF